MTEALQTLFEGKEIRVLEDAGEFWFPLPDLTEAWGVSKDTLSHQIERNKDLFAGMSGEKYVTYPTGEIQEICVNERGLYTLIGRLNTDRLKNPRAKEAILRFQRWVPELIQRYRKREIVASEPRELDEVVSDDLREAAQIAELTGTDPKLMQAAALRQHGNDMYDAFAEVLEKQALSVRHGEPGWYTVTELVALCNDPLLTPIRLNKWLENYREDGKWKPFQNREGKIWRLAPHGQPHGREYQYNLGNGHSEPRISWRSSVLYACGLKRDIAPDQVMLPQKSQY